MPTYKLKFKNPSPGMVVILAALLSMINGAAFNSAAFMQDIVIGELGPMCAGLLDIKRMMTSHTGQNVFFEISGVRCAAAVCMTAVTRLHDVVKNAITNNLYHPIVDGVRDELMLLFGSNAGCVICEIDGNCMCDCTFGLRFVPVYDL